MSPPLTARRRALAVLAELACFAAPLAALLWILREPITSLDRGLWGAMQPWGNGDFVGNFWCWWREHELQHSGVEWLEATGWPGGGGTLDQLFPNRVDAWLAMPFFELDGWWATWNGMALASLVAAVLGVVLCARLAGASRAAAASGALVLALSPTLLHELGWGRMASFQIWPGVLALAATASALGAGRRPHAIAAAACAGLLLSLQALAYPFHGLAAGSMAATVLALAPLPWRRRMALLAALALTAGLASLSWLPGQAADFSALAGAPPPAGYTSLPGAGLLGLPTVPERFRLLPLALPLALLALAHRRARPWALAGLVGIGLAMGPRILWDLGGSSLPSPVGWLMAASPWIERMHHPVRAAPLGLAALAVAAALLLDPSEPRLRWLRVAGLAALWTVGWFGQGATMRSSAWDQPVLPAGVEAARWLAAQGDGPVADPLSGEHRVGLALQPWLRRPMLESLRGYDAAAGARWSDDQRRASDALRALGRGEDHGQEALEDLADFGLEALILVDRRAQIEMAADPTPAAGVLAEHLGPPAYEDGEARVWLLPTRPR
jgi:hypothetical protein